MHEEPKLTAAQQDYLEAVYVVSQRQPDEPGVRVTDIAAELGTKLPTVVRSVARLKELKLLAQRERGLVRLTARGAILAAQLAHRHADVVNFLTTVLGVEPDQAESEACVIEHGISGETAQRLHAFLERWDALPQSRREGLAGRRRRVEPTEFTLLGEAAGSGGRQ